MIILFAAIQIVLSTLTIILILMQPPSDDNGGKSSLSATHNTKRGWEKVMYTLTISVCIFFILFSFLRMLLAGF